MFIMPRVVDLVTKQVIVLSQQVMFSSKEGYQNVPYDNVTIECELARDLVLQVLMTVLDSPKDSKHCLCWYLIKNVSIMELCYQHVQLVKIKHDFQNYSFITSSYLEHALNRQQNYQLGNGLIHSKLRCTVGLLVVDIAYQ